MHRNQHNYDKMKLEIQKILLAFALPLLLLFILYTLRTMESVMNWDFITWGIYPRETKGIMGIFTSPLIHADWGHLFANTFPLLFLLWCLLYFYRDLGIDYVSCSPYRVPSARLAAAQSQLTLAD